MDDRKGVLASDRFQLETIIADLSIGIITIETEGTLQYANQAALDMHGVLDLVSLGRTSKEYRETFVLEDLAGVPLPPSAYPFERLLIGDTFTNLHVKVPVNGSMAVHECRGICVRDKQGEIDFYALFFEDETEQYDAEQRFERTFTANPAPALINRLSDLRYIKVNQGFLEMTGFKREDIIGRTAYEFDVLASVESREQALAKFHAGEVIKPLESQLSIRSGGTKFVVVGGQPLEVGNEPCMLLTFIDLDARKKAEDAWRQGEERFSKAFALAPVASVISSASDGRIFNVNDAFKALTGYGSSEAVGRTTTELGLWGGEGEEIIAGVLKTRRNYRDLELKLHTKMGHVCDVMVSAETVSLNEEPCVLWMCLDVTEWKRTEAEMIEAVNSVMKDSDWFSTSITNKLMANKGRRPAPQAAAKLSRLTTRERQVLELICQGLSGPKIAEQLEVASNTVRNYMSHLYKKLEVHSRAELIIWARRNEVLT